MKKRILCMLLASVMLMSCFLLFGCAKETEEADVDTNTGAKTITMRVITEKKVYNTLDEMMDALKKQYPDNENLKNIEKKLDEDKKSAESRGASVKEIDLLEKLETLFRESFKDDANFATHMDMIQTMKAYQSVEDAISTKTKSDYKTKVDIFFYTEDEYNEALESDMEKYALESQKIEIAKRALDKYLKEYKDSVTEEYPQEVLIDSFFKYFAEEYGEYREKIVGKSEVAEDKYVENDYGIPEIEYPSVEETQLDIIYISGYDMYSRYIENEWIVPLNQHINTTGKKLTYYISPTLLNGVKVNGETYAIPNNVQIGEYTYMMVDKALAEKYKYTYESFGNLMDCSSFVEDIAKNHKDILPIDSSFEECMNFYVWHWNIDSEEIEDGKWNYTINTDNKFSIVGTLYDDLASVGRGEIELGFNSLLADENYRNMLITLKGYEIDGCYRLENETRTNPAISFVGGTYAMMRNAFYNEDGTKKSSNDPSYGVYTDENGKEYLLYVAKYPEADDYALYGNMFAVSANAQNPQACVEVITLINTDPAVRNLLQYGIKQGEHSEGQTPNYLLDEQTGVLKRLNSLYMMDVEKTGNCFIAYPEEGNPVDFWENAKVQNNEAIINPLAGFDFNERLAEYGTNLDNKMLEDLKKISEEIYAIINNPDATREMLETTIEGELAEKFSTKRVSYTFADGVETILRFEKISNRKYDVSSGLGYDNNGNPISDPDGENPYTVYYKWLEAYDYLPEVEE